MPNNVKIVILSVSSINIDSFYTLCFCLLHFFVVQFVILHSVFLPFFQLLTFANAVKRSIFCIFLWQIEGCFLHAFFIFFTFCKYYKIVFVLCYKVQHGLKNLFHMSINLVASGKCNSSLFTCYKPVTIWDNHWQFPLQFFAGKANRGYGIAAMSGQSPN